jgi:hypothetical protein
MGFREINVTLHMMHNVCLNMDLIYRCVLDFSSSISHQSEQSAIKTVIFAAHLSTEYPLSKLTLFYR